VTIGAADAGALYGYLFLAGIAARAIMPDFKSMVAAKNEADGRLKFTHASVRTHR
jgi:hypothetical protein